uniref:CxC2-like cysteine cluster KDZ transposase-associated domain-containing protein n=1 Tax=Mycena chlorophos TaxID=658473 RepID=A0ABQ0L1B7_MYCCL|nr:predicted protein [Mycena chlorophos]
MNTPTTTNDQLLQGYLTTWDEVHHSRTYGSPGPLGVYYLVTHGPRAGVYTSFKSALSAQPAGARMAHSADREAAVSGVARALFTERHPGPVPAALREIMEGNVRPPATYPHRSPVVAGTSTPPPSPRSRADGQLPLPVATPLHPACLWVVAGNYEARFLNDQDLAEHAAYELQLAGQLKGFFEANSYEDAFTCLEKQAERLRDEKGARANSGWAFMPATNSSGYTGGTEHYTDEVPIKVRRRGGQGAGRGVGPRKFSAYQVGAKSEASARSRAAREADREERARQEIQRMQASGGHEDPWIDADVDMEHVMQELAAEENNRAQDQEEERRAFLEKMMANLPKDTRDRSDRVQKIINGFRRVREPLTTAFLDWRADPNTCGTPWAQPWTLQDGNQQIKVHVVDIFGTNEMVLPVQRGSSHAVCLVRMGLIPCTVQFIKTAITVRTLELYRNLFLRCPKVGIQAFCSALFDLHLIPRNHNTDALFRTALDAYLDILTNADRRAAAALGRDTPNWRIQNTCPPCQYPLKDETPLDPEMQATLDGNNSAKRLDVGSRQVRADDRKAPGDFYLTREAVDKWAKENLELLKSEYAAELQEANFAPGVEPPHCPDERWKNMQENLTAMAMQAYDETGIMPCLCRHNFVLILVDMVHSGEMFKYGFAIVNHLARTLRKSVLFGYDIGCTFGRAVRRHPVLGPLTQKQRMSFLVGSFHGAGHSRICQCINLPRYRRGSGMEPYEGCEGWFSKSNALASITRTATRFHRQQAIVQYVQHANAKDAYGGLSKLLVSKYKNALSIKAQERLLDENLTILGVERSELANWVKAEYDFLAGLLVEPPVETTQMEYYHALCTLSSTKATWDKIKAETPDDTIMEQGDDEYREVVAATQRLETRRRHAKEKYDIALDDVQRLEQVLNILDRWTSDGQEYQEAAELVKHRNWHKALDELEMAAVSQAFERERLYVPGTGAFFSLDSVLHHAYTRGRRVARRSCVDDM